MGADCPSTAPAGRAVGRPGGPPRPRGRPPLLYRGPFAPTPAAPAKDCAVSLAEAEPQPPVANVIVVYLGPVAPHWEVRSRFGDRKLIEEFRARVLARLMLLPPHDPQFRRNRERVVRDAERENFQLEWDLGYPEA